jgi:SAM-dependent methyltransferase
MPTAEEVERGQAVYSPLLLRVYDLFVLGFSNRYLWRCPTAEILKFYDRNVGARHLDIGVGTGYYLDHVNWPIARPSVTLLDLNPNSLAATSRRIARFEPKIVRADCLEPFPLSERFDSVGLCYLLHCLPGSIPEKAVVLDHLGPVLAPGARVFGATILQGDLPRSKSAQALMDFYNRKGVFSNARDRLEDLESALEQRFTDVCVEVLGCVALFEARAVTRIP